MEIRIYIKGLGHRALVYSKPSEIHIPAEALLDRMLLIYLTHTLSESFGFYLIFLVAFSVEN